MANAVDESGSETPNDSDIVAADAQLEADPTTISSPVPVSEQSQSATQAYEPGQIAQVGKPGRVTLGATEDSEFVDEAEKTIISQRPVAAPAEFYKTMPLAELAAMLEGKQLDHFSVEQMIGGGGMGAVFRGRDERLDRTVAIKVIPASKRDPETLRRFRLEAQAAARLDHPNIARVYYVGEAEQWNYIVFEFIDGVNVRDLVHMDGPLSVDDSVYYTRQIAEALQHAYSREVVHRDIKPSNILVTAGGIAKVVDMGLARNTSMENSTGDATASGVTLGTFDYISPEQARDPRDADVRSDLYSLGCSWFFMLTGHPPFPEGTALQKLLNHGSLPPPDPRGWRDDLSDQLYEVLMKLMAKQPVHRYQNPHELINDLMLLAEVEDLPRSQSPGTIMMTPTVSQRSLLESNLPWMVAFAFLLGSTLWLQTAQSISSGFTLQELQFESLVSTDQLRETVDPNAGDANRNSSGDSELKPEDTQSVSESDETGKDVPRANGVEQTLPIPQDSPLSTSPIVVSEFRPADVPVDAWANSLQNAVDRLRGLGGEQEIEVRGRLLLEQPLLISDMSLNIRGDSAMRPGIDVSPSLLSGLPDGASAMDLIRSKVRMQGVDVRASFGGVAGEQQVGLFGVDRNSELAFNRCLITVDGQRRPNPLTYVVLAVEPAAEEETSVAPAPNQELAPEQVLSVIVEDTIVRGTVSLIGLHAKSDAYNRVEFSVSNSLVAVSGRAVEVSNLAGQELPVSRNVRMFCEQSTFVTRMGFAAIDYSAVAAQPMLGLNRTSSKCLFHNSPEVAHIELRGLSQENLRGRMEWILLKGTDNGYDETVRSLARYVDQAGDSELEFSFAQASQDGWFMERGNEQQIRWRHRFQFSNLSTVSPDEFRVEESMFFSPGYRANENVPSF